MQLHNFYSGPSILPPSVIAQAQQALANFENTGLSLLEISHRSKEFAGIMEETQLLAKKLMGLNDDYEVIFLQGGASSQFYMIPANFLLQNETAGYIDTGVWAHAAMEEAKLFGSVAMVASSENENYSYIPKNPTLDLGLKYTHITTNNTIYGTQWREADIVRLRQNCDFLIADTSSDILSKPFDYNLFDVVYAGAQKNIGTSGTTLVAINKKALSKKNNSLPKMMDFAVHIANKSMKNTPAVFSVYITYLTLQWIAKTGLTEIGKRNREKANLLYDYIDQSDFYMGTVKKEDRSEMNVCFLLKEASLEKDFFAYAKSNGIIGIEGHRSVGGCRASIYNALPIESVQALIKVMEEYKMTK